MIINASARISGYLGKAQLATNRKRRDLLQNKLACTIVEIFRHVGIIWDRGFHVFLVFSPVIFIFVTIFGFGCIGVIPGLIFTYLDTRVIATG